VKKSIVFVGTGTMLQLYSALPNTGSITQMPTTTIHARRTTTTNTIAIPSNVTNSYVASNLTRIPFHDHRP
jgi:hypothetical protein